MTLKSKNTHIDILLFNVSNAFFVVKQNISRWYEGAHPWSVSNNQGIGGTNKAIKKDHTFKRRCPLGTFMDLVDRMVKEWSMVDDSLLFGSRMDLLFKDKSGLKMRTDGYQWMKQCKAKGSDTIIKVDPRGKYTVSESSEFNLGKVEQLWVVASSENSMTSMPLKRLAKLRIKSRGEPEFDNFDEYMNVRTSCWILEFRNGQFFCDCPVGMKGKLCKHTVGMCYMEGIMEVTSQERAVPLGQKRKRGRPKNLGNCLMKSPPRVTVADENVAITSPPSLNISMSPPSLPAPLPGTPSATPTSPSQTPSPQLPRPATPTSPSPTPSPPRPAVRKSRKKPTPKKPKRKNVVSTLAKKSPVKRKASPDRPATPVKKGATPLESTPIIRRLRPRK